MDSGKKVANEVGSSLVETVLIISLMAVAIITSASFLGSSVSQSLIRAGDRMTSGGNTIVSTVSSSTGIQ